MLDNQYHIGIDLGVYNTTISYITDDMDQPGLLDISGGYQDVHIPTALCYVSAADQWLAGHQALLHIAEGECYFNFLSTFPQAEASLVEVTFTYVQHFLKSILGQLAHMNPVGAIVSVVLCVQETWIPYFNQYQEQIAKCLNVNHVDVMTKQSAIVRYLWHEGDMEPSGVPTCQVIDFGFLETHAYKFIWTSDGIRIDPVASTNCLSGLTLHQGIHKAMAYALTGLVYDIDVIEALVRQYLPLVFKAYKEQKSLKVFYNFIHPPFFDYIPYETLSEIFKPLIEGYNDLIMRLDQDGHGLLSTGNGLKSAWFHVIQDRLNATKSPLAYKADMIALGALHKSPPIADRPAIGIYTGHPATFFPMIPKGMSGPYTSEPVVLILECDGQEPCIELYEAPGLNANKDTILTLSVPQSENCFQRCMLYVTMDEKGNVNGHIRQLAL